MLKMFYYNYYNICWKTSQYKYLSRRLLSAWHYKLNMVQFSLKIKKKYLLVWLS